MNRWIHCLIALLACAWLPAEAQDRFVSKARLPSGQHVVIAEGEYEARSIGSFSIRLYESAEPGNETTFFSAGLVRFRNGSIEKVDLADIDGDQKPEIVVSIRSAGSGGYLSAYAFSYDDRQLLLLVSVDDLAPSADVQAALAEATAANRENQ